MTSSAVTARRWLIPLIAVLAGGGVVRAQAAGKADALLQRMAEQSAEYRKSLPDFTCNESVVSSVRQSWLRKARVEFQATIRVTRTPDGALAENFFMTKYMGTPVAPGVRLPVPDYVQGGFGRGVPLFFAAENQRCFVYSAEGDKIDFKVRHRARGCLEPASTEGYAQLDAAGLLQHGETRRVPEEAKQLGLTTLTSEDYGPVELDGKEFRLPVHLYAEIRDGKMLRTFEAKYSECRLFKVSVTIKPGDSDPAGLVQ